MAITDPIDQAADFLAQARVSRERFSGLPEICRPADEAAAYKVQARLHDKLEALGQGPVIARKIGCTTLVMQRYLGIHNPCAGGLFGSTVQVGEGRFRHDDFVRVGVECEIAVRLGADAAPRRSAPHDPESVRPLVDAVMAAIEIVDDRYADYKALDTPTLIADDFFNAGAVLGPPIEDWRDLDLARLEGRMSVNGEMFGPGCGADILGHPLNALAWLANAVQAQGGALRAGEIILLGSVVQTKWLDPGDVVEVDIEGLGKVKATFA